MSGKRRGNGPFKMTLAQQARTMSYYNPAIKKENFLTADRNEIQPVPHPGRGQSRDRPGPARDSRDQPESVQDSKDQNESKKGHSLYYHRKIYYEKLQRKLSIGHFLNILF